jgi:putative transposase
MSEIVTDKLKSYRVALRELEYVGDHVSDKGSNNPAENSHQRFRRRERSMQRFQSMGALQKFVSVHSQIHNHFNNERHVLDRKNYKMIRARSIQEWKASCA